MGAPFEFGSTGAAAQRQLAAIVQSSHDAIMGKTLDGRITSWNPGAERLYGYTAQEMVGRRVDALFLPAWVATEASVMSRIAGGERVEQFQIERRHKDGGTIMVSLSLSPIADDTGALVGVASVSRDVSERQAARERLKSQAERDRLEARLHQSQRLESLGQLAGGVAHDFNNLLAVMLNYTTFVAEQITARAEADPGGQWQDVRNDITQIQRAGERATELTHQLLAFGRREVVRPQILNLNTVLGEIEPFLRRTLGEHIQLRPQPAADLWPVLADPGQLEQVLVNLAVNARDAMPKGGTLTIGTTNRILDQAAAETRTGLRPGRHVELWIADTGTGIPPAIAERVFEPFFTTKPKGEGSGLGLATVYGIIVQAGGHAAISSTPGAGTTFTVLLPATDQTAAPAEKPAAPQLGGGGETVLIVEDEEALREVARRILARNGYQVLTAASGPEALKLVEHTTVDIHLLLTDVIMPRMLGKELADKLAELRPAVRVLYMSGYAQPVLASQGTLDSGVTLVEKPFSEPALLARVRDVLDTRLS